MVQSLAWTRAQGKVVVFCVYGSAVETQSHPSTHQVTALASSQRQGGARLGSRCTWNFLDPRTLHRGIKRCHLTTMVDIEADTSGLFTREDPGSL